jgi:hypothetical protein
MPIFAVDRDVTKVTKGLPCDALGVFDPILVRFGITAGRTFLVDRIDLGMVELHAKLPKFAIRVHLNA